MKIDYNKSRENLTIDRARLLAMIREQRVLTYNLKLQTINPPSRLISRLVREIT